MPFQKFKSHSYFRLLLSSCCYRNRSHCHPFTAPQERQETQQKQAAVCFDVGSGPCVPSCSLRVPTRPQSTPQQLKPHAQRCKHPLAVVLMTPMPGGGCGGGGGQDVGGGLGGFRQGSGHMLEDQFQRESVRLIVPGSDGANASSSLMKRTLICHHRSKICHKMKK